jgi:uncharacterized protein YlxW (UPF0749 family)
MATELKRAQDKEAQMQSRIVTLENEVQKLKAEAQEFYSTDRFESNYGAFE